MVTGRQGGCFIAKSCINSRSVMGSEIDDGQERLAYGPLYEMEKLQLSHIYPSDEKDRTNTGEDEY